VRAISACLLGVACRYDGHAATHPAALALAAREPCLPLCPEQLGGLPTPRPAAQIVGGTGADVLDGRARVVDADGRDVTTAFCRGAQEAADLCARLGVQAVVLKARSPSCGAGCIYQGDRLVSGDGVAAALLRRRGLRVESHPD
jgi:uncharacterized protein YbbK (DUF523 family)